MLPDENSSNEGQDPITLPEPTQPIAMVVEDDEIVVVLLESMLSRRGFQVEIARDGRQALNLIDTLADPPTFVLLDVMLPYFDGFDLIRKIREQVAWNGVPIIMLTAKSQERHIVRALDDGANDYVVKPFRPGELMARIRRVTKT